MIWDQRYATEDYVYGTEPNEFLAETIRGLSGGARQQRHASEVGQG